MEWNNLYKYFVPLQGSDGNGGKYDEQCEIILNATDKLCNSMGNAAVMVKQARLLGQVGFSRNTYFWKIFVWNVSLSAGKMYFLLYRGSNFTCLVQLCKYAIEIARA